MRESVGLEEENLHKKRTKFRFYAISGTSKRTAQRISCWRQILELVDMLGILSFLLAGTFGLTIGLAVLYSTAT